MLQFLSKMSRPVLLWLMLQKLYDVLQIHMAQSFILYKFFLEIPSLYLDFVPESLNTLVYNSYEDITQ